LKRFPLSPRLLAVRVLVCSIALLLTGGETFSASDLTPGVPVCIYASKSYSSGALLCIHKSLALVCRSEGSQATWATLADNELAERCGGPIVSPYRPRLHAAFRTRRREPVATGANGALQSKCFDFAGKRYCE
jgi:hypothetical protein